VEVEQMRPYHNTRSSKSSPGKIPSEKVAKEPMDDVTDTPDGDLQVHVGSKRAKKPDDIE
jgi:hypothetical protein